MNGPVKCGMQYEVTLASGEKRVGTVTEKLAHGGTDCPDERYRIVFPDGSFGFPYERDLSKPIQEVLF